MTLLQRPGGPLSTHVIATSSLKPGCNLWTRLLATVAMVTHTCSAHCFALFPSDPSLSESEVKMAHKYSVLEKVVHELGKFLIGAWNSWRVGQFLCESCWDGNALLLCCFGSNGKMKTLSTGNLYGKFTPWNWHACMHTSSASLPLHKWKWSCGAICLSKTARLLLPKPDLNASLKRLMHPYFSHKSNFG